MYRIAYTAYPYEANPYRQPGARAAGTAEPGAASAAYAQSRECRVASTKGATSFNTYSNFSIVHEYTLYTIRSALRPGPSAAHGSAPSTGPVLTAHMKVSAAHGSGPLINTEDMWVCRSCCTGEDPVEQRSPTGSHSGNQETTVIDQRSDNSRPSNLVNMSGHVGSTSLDLFYGPVMLRISQDFDHL